MARLCDQRQILFASNVATAEVLILGLNRGDLDWRDIVNPKKEIVSPKGIIITMDKIKPRTLSGFMELPPDKQVQMDKMRAVLAETYARYGFTPLDTPAIEAAEVLLAKGGGETEKQIYRFTKGDSDLALRFDLTVPLAKYVAANYGQLTFPFRRYQIGKVWRGERAQRGRFREFYQADIDIIGDGALDILNEAEIPAIIYDTFTRLGLHRFRIRVNNRKVLNGFFAILGLGEQAGDVLRTIDKKLDKIGADKVRALLTDTCGVTSEQADEILRFIACPGTSADKLAFLEQYRGRNETFDTGLDELRTVVGYLPAFGVPEENFELDLTIARGLDYYTGTVYETVLLDHPEVGSICSGGRYDDLAGYYTNKSLPGVGISIGLTRLFYILQEQNMISDAVLTAPADVLILPMTDDLSAAVALASMLRAGGLRVQLYSERKKFKAKIGYADKLGIPFVIFLGEDEIAQHVCALKNYGHRRAGGRDAGDCARDHPRGDRAPQRRRDFCASRNPVNPPPPHRRRRYSIERKGIRSMFQSRTHTCNELRLENAGEQVRIVGWMENVREVGQNFAFVVVRDFYGTTQVVIETEDMMKVVKALNKGVHHRRGGHRARAREQKPQAAHRRH